MADADVIAFHVWLDHKPWDEHGPSDVARTIATVQRGTRRPGSTITLYRDLDTYDAGLARRAVTELWTVDDYRLTVRRDRDQRRPGEHYTVTATLRDAS